MESHGLQLDGWADIAAHLGVSPQTAKELEDRLGLPVRRMRTPGGEIVYAFVSELDQWLHDRGARLATLPPPVPVAERGDTPPRAHLGTAPSRRSRAWAWLAEVALLCAIIAGVAAWRWLSPSPLASASIEEPLLVVRDGTGRVLWSHEVGYVQRRGVESARTGISTGPILTDIDGDGHHEVLVVASGSTDPSGAYGEGLVCLSDTGRMRWRFSPGPLVIGNASDLRPWRLVNVVVSRTVPAPAIWSAWTRGSDGPAIVVRVDTSGHGDVVLVNTGTSRNDADIRPR